MIVVLIVLFYQLQKKSCGKRWRSSIFDSQSAAEAGRVSEELGRPALLEVGCDTIQMAWMW
jgi:hypothetical protein